MRRYIMPRFLELTLFQIIGTIGAGARVCDHNDGMQLDLVLRCAVSWLEAGFDLNADNRVTLAYNMDNFERPDYRNLVAKW